MLFKKSEQRPTSIVSPPKIINTPWLKNVSSDRKQNKTKQSKASHFSFCPCGKFETISYRQVVFYSSSCSERAVVYTVSHDADQRTSSLCGDPVSHDSQHGWGLPARSQVVPLCAQCSILLLLLHLTWFFAVSSVGGRGETQRGLCQAPMTMTFVGKCLGPGFVLHSFQLHCVPW